MEYTFGTGDGDPSVWLSEADLDLGDPGAPDAVVLDFDGDGLLDDALWDSDGDGRADRSVLDAGEPSARYFTDPTGLGTWEAECAPPGVADERGIDTDGDGVADAALEPPGPGGGHWSMLVDEGGDGAMDVRLSDTDGDGRLDTVTRPAGSASARKAEVGDER
nr:hypothetical protein [Rhodococcus spelaei]